jgi:hypothetical protein
MLDNKCRAEPLSVILDVFLDPLFRSRSKRVEQENSSFVVNENVRSRRFLLC